MPSPISLSILKLVSPSPPIGPLLTRKWQTGLLSAPLLKLEHVSWFKWTPRHQTSDPDGWEPPSK